MDEITSPVFEGLIAMREPSKSWIARWQRIDGFKKGMYAVKVSGNVSIPNPLHAVACRSKIPEWVERRRGQEGMRVEKGLQGRGRR